jgi:hypothetical protein
MLKYLVFFILVSSTALQSYSFVEVENQQQINAHYFSGIYTYIRSSIEGNYVNHPMDKGEETYGGISRKLHPDWFGWKYVDNDQLKYRNKRIERAEPWVLDFYLTLWVREGFENIENKDLALNLFDFRIHSSARTVTKLTSKVLTEMGCEPIVVEADWVDNRFNRIDSKEFILRLKIQRLILFNNLVDANPTQMVFYTGWINRLENI